MYLLYKLIHSLVEVFKEKRLVQMFIYNKYLCSIKLFESC